ncbi:kinase-like protein [Ramaria rubella]|nr:kinase-like protein [Ramaria rubella]
MGCDANGDIGPPEGKNSKEGSGSRSTTPILSPPTASRLSNSEPVFETGLLTICILSGRGLSLPQGLPLPDVIQKQLEQQPQGRLSTSNRDARESMWRKRAWWLPYVVLEFDKNEILVNALDGEISAPHWRYKAHFDVSRISNISVAAYLRTSASASGQEIGNDLLVGRVDFMPALDAYDVVDHWYAATAGSGEFHLQIAFKPTQDESLTIEAFELLKVIGKGSFGKVMQVRKKDTQRIYALKRIRIAHIASRPGEITHIPVERTVLALVNSPFIVPLKFSFQNQDKLYLVMSFVGGGELFYHLPREGKFDQGRSRFYAAELLCALEHVHSFNFVYRRLKPENILLEFTGHIALCDFGLCRLNMSQSDMTHSFHETPDYMAPELLKGEGYTKTVDWWTLGVLLYEMMMDWLIRACQQTSLPPFYDENINTMYQRILYDPPQFPDDMQSDAKSIMTGLLNKDPSKRLGVNGGEEIMMHPFFKSIDWNKLLAKNIQPPFKPSVESVLDVANFDPECASEALEEPLVTDSKLSETVLEQFKGFSFNPNNEHLCESVG